ncbi:unnamed protein product [Caenorhabditis nigoni]
MKEPPRNQTFGLLKYPFLLREQIIRNLDFMDAFYFSTLSKRSKQMVHNAKYPVISIDFMFTEDSTNDHIEVEHEYDKFLKISLWSWNVPNERDPNTIDGLELANLIDEPSDDYRKKICAHLLFAFHFRWTSVKIERNIENLSDLFLWDIRKKFDDVEVRLSLWLEITPEDLHFVLNSLDAKQYYLIFSLNDSNYKYREPLGCEHLEVPGSIQWLDTDDFLKRNPSMKQLCLKNLTGEQINDLIKQWINGEAIGLDNMVFFYGIPYPENLILDEIVTMETKLTEEQARRIFGLWDNRGRTVDIHRTIDGQIATVYVHQYGCFVRMWNEKRLAELEESRL